MKLRELSSALRLLLLMTVSGWLGFQFLGRAVLWLVFGADRGTGEQDRYDIYGMVSGMLLALAVHLWRKMKTAEHLEQQFVRTELLALAIGSLMIAGYCSGYVSTGWLVGRGLMSPAMQSRLDHTIYYPITFGRKHDIMPMQDLERVRRKAAQIGFASARRK